MHLSAIVGALKTLALFVLVSGCTTHDREMTIEGESCERLLIEMTNDKKELKQ